MVVNMLSIMFNLACLDISKPNGVISEKAAFHRIRYIQNLRYHIKVCFDYSTLRPDGISVAL